MKDKHDTKTVFDTLRENRLLTILLVLVIGGGVLFLLATAPPAHAGRRHGGNLDDDGASMEWRQRLARLQAEKLLHGARKSNGAAHGAVSNPPRQATWQDGDADAGQTNVRFLNQVMHTTQFTTSSQAETSSTTSSTTSTTTATHEHNAVGAPGAFGTHTQPHGADALDAGAVVAAAGSGGKSAPQSGPPLLFLAADRFYSEQLRTSSVFDAACVQHVELTPLCACAQSSDPLSLSAYRYSPNITALQKWPLLWNAVLGRQPLPRDCSVHWPKHRCERLFGATAPPLLPDSDDDAADARTTTVSRATSAPSAVAQCTAADGALVQALAARWRQGLLVAIYAPLNLLETPLRRLLAERGVDEANATALMWSSTVEQHLAIRFGAYLRSTARQVQLAMDAYQLAAQWRDAAAPAERAAQPLVPPVLVDADTYASTAPRLFSALLRVGAQAGRTDLEEAQHWADALPHPIADAQSTTVQRVAPLWNAAQLSKRLSEALGATLTPRAPSAELTRDVAERCFLLYTQTERRRRKRAEPAQVTVDWRRCFAMLLGFSPVRAQQQLHFLL